MHQNHRGGFVTVSAMALVLGAGLAGLANQPENRTQPDNRHDNQSTRDTRDTRDTLRDRMQESKPGMAKPLATPITRDDCERTLKSWPEKPMSQVRKTMEKYGMPSSIGSHEAVWYDAGPYRYIRVYSEEVAHDFPAHHTDFYEQAVFYRVPAEKASSLDMFDGSVLIDRTKGLLAARCDKEENNLLALNLANDVITGTKTVEEARAYFGKAIAAAMQGEKDPYMKDLTFKQGGPSAADPDYSTIDMKGMKPKDPMDKDSMDKDHMDKDRMDHDGKMRRDGRK